MIDSIWDIPVSELMHSDLQIDYVDLLPGELLHFKYIKREKLSNGRYRYYYDKKERIENGKSEVSKSTLRDKVGLTALDKYRAQIKNLDNLRDTVDNTKSAKFRADQNVKRSDDNTIGAQYHKNNQTAYANKLNQSKLNYQFGKINAAAALKKYESTPIGKIESLARKGAKAVTDLISKLFGRKK